MLKPLCTVGLVSVQYQQQDFRGVYSNLIGVEHTQEEPDRQIRLVKYNWSVFFVVADFQIF